MDIDLNFQNESRRWSQFFWTAPTVIKTLSWWVCVYELWYGDRTLKPMLSPRTSICKFIFTVWPIIVFQNSVGTTDSHSKLFEIIKLVFFIKQEDGSVSQNSFTENCLQNFLLELYCLLDAITEFETEFTNEILLKLLKNLGKTFYGPSRYDLGKRKVLDTC